MMFKRHPAVVSTQCSNVAHCHGEMYLQFGSYIAGATAFSANTTVSTEYIGIPYYEVVIVVLIYSLRYLNKDSHLRRF